MTPEFRKQQSRFYSSFKSGDLTPIDAIYAALYACEQLSQSHPIESIRPAYEKRRAALRKAEDAYYAAMEATYAQEIGVQS